MDENLVGYLLQALDADTHREVEVFLQAHPEARRRLEVLRQALAPLDADRDTLEPPPELCLRTLARVAEHQCRKLPQAPRPGRGQLGLSRSRWRRADLLVAASILLCLGLLVPPVLSRVKYTYERQACADNLRVVGRALVDYRERHPEAGFPNPAREPEPYNIAGFAVPVLREEGLLTQNVDLRCPPRGAERACLCRACELRKMEPDRFAEYAPHLLGCYAYSLGYQNEAGEVQNYGGNDGRVPLMADCPPGQGAVLAGRNSDNHGGKGQNLLLSDGSVEWLTGRTWHGDDIFLNRDQAVAPGVNQDDYVLGVSTTPVRHK